MRVGSAKDESTFENGEGSTDLEITASSVLCQPRNNKDGKTMEKGRHPQQSRALENTPSRAARLLLSARAVSSSASPTQDRSISVRWAS